MAWTPMNKWELQTEVDLFPFGPHSESMNKWDISNVTDLSNLFKDKTYVLDTTMLSTWNVSRVTNMRGMFSGAINMNANINSWDVSKVRNMDGMFARATSFNQPLNSWDVSGVTGMSEMFAYATSFNQPLQSWNVTNVTYMADMFFNATSFNQSLKTWRVPKLEMFGGSNSQITELFVFTPGLEALHVENCKLTTIQIPTNDIDFKCRNNPFTLTTIEKLIHYFQDYPGVDPTGLQLYYLLQRKDYLLTAAKTVRRKLDGRLPSPEVLSYLGGKTTRRHKKNKKSKSKRSS